MGKKITRKLETLAFPIDVEYIENRESLMDYIWQRSSLIMIMHNSHDPMLMFFEGNVAHMALVGEFIDGEMNKNQLADIMHQIAERPTVDAIALVTEGWRVKFKEMDDAKLEKVLREGAAAQDDRIECLQVLLECRGQVGMLMKTGDVVRGGDGNVIALVNEDMNATGETRGRFTNLFPRGQA